MSNASSDGDRAPRLLDQVRDAIRTKHYSFRTEKAYVGWIRRFIVFNGTRHPSELGAAEVARYLQHLAVQGRVAASTQNQAAQEGTLDDLTRRGLERLPQPLSRVAGRHRGGRASPQAQAGETGDRFAAVP